MNIVSIMTELISRQKIAKRHSKSSKSLVQTASVFRETGRLQTNRNRFASGGLKKSLLKSLKNRKVRRPAKRNSDNSSVKQNVKKRFVFTEKIKKLILLIQTRVSAVNTMVLIGVCTVLVLGTAAAFFIYGYIENRNLFDELSLFNDLDISDVLYESLPSDYYGQGSGEIAGIEPVLLTVGEPVSYTVKPGDTLSEISKKNNIKIGTLISFNKITDVRRLQVGMELKIPGYDGVPYEVKAGDSLEGISKKYNISVNSLLDANDMASDIIQPGDVLFIPGAAMNEFDYKKAMGTLFIYPTRGRLSSGFGYRADPFTGQRRFHNGIDLANAVGTKIIATMSGVVADVGDRPSGYGKYVIIKHANGYQSLYGHLSRITVREGQYIYQNEKIGEMGNTGRSTGPHLHFSIYKNNIPVNPNTYLW